MRGRHDRNSGEGGAFGGVDFGAKALMAKRSQPCKDQAGDTARAKPLRLDWVWNRVAGAGDAAKAMILQESGCYIKKFEAFSPSGGKLL